MSRGYPAEPLEIVTAASKRAAAAARTGVTATTGATDGGETG